jgi:hypothetical protein
VRPRARARAFCRPRFHLVQARSLSSVWGRLSETRFTDDADDGTIDERNVFTYDDAHRIIRTEQDVGNDGSIESRIDITYDAAGEVIQEDYYRDGAWRETIVRDLDSFGRPLSERTLWAYRPPDRLSWSYACPTEAPPKRWTMFGRVSRWNRGRAIRIPPPPTPPPATRAAYRQ